MSFLPAPPGKHTADWTAQGCIRPPWGREKGAVIAQGDLHSRTATLPGWSERKLKPLVSHQPFGMGGEDLLLAGADSLLQPLQMDLRQQSSRGN